MNKNTSGWLATFISHLGYDYSTGCRREGGKNQNLKYLEIDNRRGFEPHHCSRLVTAPSGGAGHAHPQPAWQTEIVSLAQISNEKIIPHLRHPPPHLNIPIFVPPPNITFLSNSLMEFY